MTNNNFHLESKMKRQSSLQASASPTSSKDQPMERQSSEAETMTMMTTSGSTSTSTPLHSTSTVPASPFRLMREESVDGTLSPVSLKGGMETLDNDTTDRRKVSSSRSS